MSKLTLFLLCLFCSCCGNEFRLHIHVKNLPEKSNPLLLRIYNGNTYVLDSLPSRQKDLLSFQIPASTHTGMFRLILNPSSGSLHTGEPTKTLDILFNKAAINLSVDYNDPSNSIQVLQSPENKIYFDFQKKDQYLLHRIASLEQIIGQYPVRDEFYHSSLQAYENCQLEREKYIDSLVCLYPGTLAARIILQQKQPFIPAHSTKQERDSIYKNHYLDHIDFKDTTLLYTNVYTDRLFQYLRFFLDPHSSLSENETLAIQALEKIIPQISENEQVRSALLKFLTAGFKSMKMNGVLVYLSNSYTEQCGGSINLIEERLHGYEKMIPGYKIPSLLVTDIQDQPIDIESELSPYTLLLFWQTSCTHCKTLLSALSSLRKEGVFTPVKVIGISIDEEKENWIEFSRNFPMDWINTFAGGGFYGPAASRFNLFATPSLFLLDENHRILSKPTTLEELKRDIEDLK